MKILTKLVTFAVVLSSFAILNLASVDAQETGDIVPQIQSIDGQLCEPGTGTDAAPCVPCVRGPYKICVPNTGSLETIVESPVLGSLALLVPAIIGLSLINNGVVLKKSLNNNLVIKK